MKQAINRFWDWIIHPSIRWYRYPKRKAAWYRYPSPGNQINQNSVEDYKTPFETSTLNIRYQKPIQSVLQTGTAQIGFYGIGFSVEDKLKSAGFLKDGQNTQETIQKSKQKFKQAYGFAVDQQMFRNDFSDVKIASTQTRQSIRQQIQTEFKAFAEIKKRGDDPDLERKFIQEPSLLWLQSVDMFSDPHFQQARVQIHDRLDNHASQRAKKGYIEIKKGEKSFWKALDDSNDIKNIQNVQKSIGDDKPTDFTLRQTKIILIADDNGNVVDVQPKTRSV